MTTLILAAKRQLEWTAQQARAYRVWRFAVLAAPAALAVSDPAAREIILNAVSDAYLQVSVFVAATLAIFYGLESRLNVDTGELLARYRHWQVPIAAVLGASPGCGGAIMVVTQYIRGNLGFGSMVAVLTSTMGDAVFLLLAQEPLTGLGVMVLGFTVGILSGYTVEALHGRDFLRSKGSAVDTTGLDCHAGGLPQLRPLWLALFVPGLMAGILAAFQYDVDAWFGPWTAWQPTLWLGAAGALLALLMWGAVPIAGNYQSFAAGDTKATPPGRPACAPPNKRNAIARVIADTNFVTVWVIAAYLAYDLGIHYSGVDLKAWFHLWAPVGPLLGVLVGFLPGCGPQIMVTTLYLNGIVPLSTQIGNAISNDGDALFPAIALAPRVALAATLYSAVPAVILAYAYYWLWE